MDPRKILVKIKLHALSHLPDQIRRRGPAVRFSTEVFECFNAVFRMCSVLSNHQAPSRDIAVKFADLDRVKHILSGGYWCDEGKWVQAGADVRSLLRKTAIIQKHLGWAPQPTWTAGHIKYPSRKKAMVLKASATLIGTSDNPFQFNIDPMSEWMNGLHVTAFSGDQCKLGSWCVFKIDNAVRYLVRSSQSTVS
jgi:hypothetical protein